MEKANRPMIDKIVLEVRYYDKDDLVRKSAGSCIVSNDLKELDKLFKIAKKNVKDELEIG